MPARSIRVARIAGIPVFGALALGLPTSTPAALRAFVGYRAEINLLILGFNLVPAFPLDGSPSTHAVRDACGRLRRGAVGDHRRDG